LGGAAKEVEGCGADGDAAGAFEVGGEGLGSGGRGLYGYDAGEVGGECAGEETDTGEKIPRERAFVAGGDSVDKGIDEPAVYLEESSVVDAVIEPGGAVGEGGCAPLGYGTRGVGVLAGAGFKKKLRAGEGGDALAPGLNELIEAIAFSGGGEDAGLEGGFGRVAEESKLGGTQGWGGLAGNVRKSLRGFEKQRRGDGALADWNDRVRASAAVAGISRRVEGQADAIAVMPGIGGEDVDFAGNWNSGAVEGFTKNGLLEDELRLVTGVLILAAATGSEVPAGGSDALGSDDDDLLGLGGGVAALVVGDADARLLAGQREGDEDGLAFNMGEECAAVDGFFDVDELGLRKNWVSLVGTYAFFLRG